MSLPTTEEQSVETNDIILIDDKTKNPYEEAFTSTGSLSNFSWAKARRTDDPQVFEIMQGFVGCKDYVMDTQFRSQSYFNADKWSQEHIRDNCVVIYTQNTGLVHQFKHHLETFLNPLEQKQGLQLTQIHQITHLKKRNKKAKSSGNFYVVHGDNRWNVHGNAWSTYLSLVRAMFHTSVELSPKTITGFYSVCTSNEYSYWGQDDRKKERHAFIKAITNDVAALLQPIPKGYEDYTGYATNAPGHGSLGTFYLANVLAPFMPHIKTYQKYKVEYTYKYNYFFDSYLKGLT